MRSRRVLAYQGGEHRDRAQVRGLVASPEQSGAAFS